MLKLSVPAILVPGLILAASLGWNWQKELKRQNYYENRRLFPLTATVKEAQDGDTLLLESGLSVRLLGVNAPERGEPLYLEAKNFVARVSAGKKVQLEYEKNYQEDKFGRILAYVWLIAEVRPLQGSDPYAGNRVQSPPANGQRVFLNELLVREGFAKVTLYKDRRKLIYQDRLLEAERETTTPALLTPPAATSPPY